VYDQKKKYIYIDGRTTTNPQQSWIPTGTTQNTTAAIQRAHTHNHTTAATTTTTSFFSFVPPSPPFLPPSFASRRLTRSVIHRGGPNSSPSSHVHTHYTTLSSTQLKTPPSFLYERLKGKMLWIWPRGAAQFRSLTLFSLCSSNGEVFSLHSELQYRRLEKLSDVIEGSRPDDTSYNLSFSSSPFLLWHPIVI
jgi:hypothetical protein